MLLRYFMNSCVVSFILDIMWHFVPTQVIDHGRKNPTMHAYQLHVGPMRPTRYGIT